MFANAMKPYPYVVAIIQARLGSHRLPRKMLEDIDGMPMLSYVIRRVQRAKTVHQVVVATPNKELHELAYDSGAWGFEYKGDENNVLGRYLACCGWCDPDIVVRITGDCPLIDPEIIDSCVKGFVDNRVDLCTNVHPRSYIKGFDVEVLHKNVLKRIFHLTREPKYLEHVTLFAHENPGLFVWNNISDSVDRSEFNVSVDTQADLDRVRDFVVSIGSNTFTYTDVVRWHELDRIGNKEQGGPSS